MAVTAVIAGVPAAGCAIGTTLQAVPLKWSASATVCPVDAANAVPATQMLLGEDAEMDWLYALGRKPAFRQRHPAPRAAVPVLEQRPARPGADRVGVARRRSRTELSSASRLVIASAVSTVHAVPFQCSSRVVSEPPTMVPTAHASVALLALTENSAAFRPRAGVGTNDHAVPFQWNVGGAGAGAPAGANCVPTAHASVFALANAEFSTTLFPLPAATVVTDQPPAANDGVAAKVTSALASAPAASHLFRVNIKNPLLGLPPALLPDK